MASIPGLSRKRGIFQDADSSPAAKRQATCNPEYLAAFQMFDADNSGTIDVFELKNALRAVKQSVEAGTATAMTQGALAFEFQDPTVYLLAARFGVNGVIGQPQFTDILVYVQNCKNIFLQIDADHSGSIDVRELGQALQLSSWQVPSLAVVQQIAGAYDTHGTCQLQFDEFVQLRLEWDTYIAAWERSVMPGAQTIAPEQLLRVLEDIKQSMEPVSQVALPQLGGAPWYYQLGVLYQTHRPFSVRTCQNLIIKFGGGNPHLSFEAFCRLMVFLKEMKKAFCTCDDFKDGALEVSGLSKVFAFMGMPLPPQAIVQIGQRFDEDGSGKLEFDEFVQLMTEYNDMRNFQNVAQTMNFGQDRVTACDLQRFFGEIRVVYRTIGGVVPSIRKFSMQTCRWLVALYGTPMPGQAYAQFVTFPQLLELVTFVKHVAWRFELADRDNDGSISFVDLVSVFQDVGLALPLNVIQNITRSYDPDLSGTLEFDEFLMMYLETLMYHRCFKQNVNPATGVLSMDEAGFFALLYSVPRNLSV